MKLERESLENIKRQILEIIGKRVDLKVFRVFFFGSRVTGKSSETSDIDVGIEGSEPLPGRVLSEIRDEIAELPILYKIDVVDFSDVNEKFKAVAKQNIEYIN